MDLSHIVTLSLIITAIHTLFIEGGVLAWLRVAVANQMDWRLGLKASRYIQKPLWDCLPCMASVWGIVLTWSFNVPLLLCVCGMLTIIDKLLNYEREPG